MSSAARSTHIQSGALATWRAGGTVLLLGLALADFVVHMLVSTNHGYFRDELYYREAGRHLPFGYVDFPPLIALLAKFLDVLAGDALWAILLAELHDLAEMIRIMAEGSSRIS